MPLTVLPDSRFACQGSGGCCSGYVFGPVEDAVVAAVRAHTFTQNAALIAEEDPFPIAERGLGSSRVLRTVNARCVFLSPESRCVIHEELGAASKPAICRAYPYLFTAAPDGARFVSLNMECAGHADARTAGPLVSAQLPDLEALARELPALVVPDPMPITAALAVPYARYLRLDQAWLRGLRARAEPIPAHLRHLCQQLLAFEAGVDDPPDGVADHGGTALPGGAAHDAAVAGLVRLTQQWMLDEKASGNVVQSELCARVMVALERLAGDAPASRLDLLARASQLHAAFPWGDPDVHALFRDQLENVVFGKRLHLAAPVKVGLGFEILKVTTAASLAAVMAARSGEPRIEAPHAAEGIRVVNRVLRHSIVMAALADRAAVAGELVDETAAFSSRGSTAPRAP